LRAHWIGVKHVLRSLKQTRDLRLTFKKTGSALKSFCDADFAQSKFDRKSFSGLMILLANATVIWSCRKQTNVSMSTGAAEYVAISSAVPEVLWLSDLLDELGFGFLAPKPAMLCVDNNGAICLAKNRSLSRETKSIDIRHHFIQDEYQKGRVTYEHVPSNQNLADICTKSLSPSVNKGFLASIGLQWL